MKLTSMGRSFYSARFGVDERAVQYSVSLEDIVPILLLHGSIPFLS